MYWLTIKLLKYHIQKTKSARTKIQCKYRKRGLKIAIQYFSDSILFLEIIKKSKNKK